MAVLLTLACSQLPLGGSTIPGPATVEAALTGTHAAAEGQPPPATPTVAATDAPTTESLPTQAATTPATATPPEDPDTVTQPAASATSPVVEGARPRLSAGQPANIVRLNMLDTTNGWAVGYPANDPSHYILRTADGGQTWVDVSPPVPSGTPWAATAFFLDNDRAWVTFANSEAPPLPAEPALVWRTQDGGQTWHAGQPLNLSDAEYSAPSDLVFVDHLRGWLLTHVGAGMNHDYVMLFTTGDGGQTWQRIADPLSTAADGLPMSCGKTGIAFLNAETGWVGGDCHGVAPGVYFHRTDDGGVTWQPQALPPPPGAASLFTNETVGCGTYSLSPLPPQTLKLALVCQDFVNSEVTVWVYGSPDAGQTWEASPLPGRDLFFLDPNLVWSIAEGDVNNPNAPRQIYRSDDGGQSWAELNTVNWGAQLDFVSPEEGWAVATAGEETALVHSSDGGSSWQLIEPTVGE